MFMLRLYTAHTKNMRRLTMLSHTHTHTHNQTVYQRICGSVHPGAGALPLERVPRGLAHGIVVELEPDPADGVVHVGPVVALVAGLAIKNPPKKTKKKHLKNSLKMFFFFNFKFLMKIIQTFLFKTDF
jgi:hypothetical protein